MDSPVNLHPVPDRDRLSRAHDETLARLIVLHRSGAVPESRLQLAGIPPLANLDADRQRRERSQQEVA